MAFFIVVTDDDRRVFDVIGPTQDDTACIEAVVRLQATGRKIRCHRPPSGLSQTELAKRCQEELGYLPAAEPIV